MAAIKGGELFPDPATGKDIRKEGNVDGV